MSKSIKLLMIAVPLCLFIQPLNAFELGAEAQIQQNRAIYGTVAADMLVGDKMRVLHIVSFCQNEGKLGLLGFAHPYEKSDYSAEVIATMINGGRVSLTVSIDHMKNPNRLHISFFIYSCAFFDIDELIPVSDINGFTSLEAYLASDFVTNLPRP